MTKVSVIVPVYNPGANIDRCISSLLGQSLPPDDYELVFVDDGSTDSTPARLDELARSHAHVRVEHTPNSGWPGRPRNIGLELARGEFVYFVDNDDWLGRQALERLHGAAERYESDIVIGKVVGHGRLVPRTLFVRNRRETSLAWQPLLGLLTPHKLFRKSLLDEHGIRFPEGRRRLEDHLFVVHAYFHARRISVVASYPCYHWMRSPADVNASWRQFDPAGYFDNVREVLDLVDRHTEPGPVREGMYAQWYRGKMLGRVGGAGFLRREPQYRRELYEEVRRLALERYPPEIDRELQINLRVRAQLLRAGRYEALETLARFESHLWADVAVRRAGGEGDTFTIELTASLGSEREPLVLVRRGARFHWLPPEGIRDELPEQMLDMTDELPKGRVQVLLHSVAEGTEYVVPSASETVLVSAPGPPGAKRPVLIARADIDRTKAAAGVQLPPGEWDVKVVVEVGGFRASAQSVRPPAEGLLRLRRGTTLTLVAPWGHGLLPRPRLRRRLARRFPRLARIVGSGRAGRSRR